MATRPKFRTLESYARRAPSREPYDSVLIVCEGQKTEPYYFHGQKRYYRLSNIEIISVGGGDPLGIVQRAIQRLDRDKELARAYCVFDRDGHAQYEAALGLLFEHPFCKAGRLFVANSVPCFELWPLLHFSYSTAPFVAGGGRSAGANVLRALQEHWPGYTKGRADAFEFLAAKLDKAIENARKLKGYNAKTGSDNPATAIHDLVDYLRNLKK